MIRLAFLALLMVVQANVAEAKWREASTRHFLIYSEASEAELRRAAEQIERYDSTLRVATGVGDPERSPATRVTIFFVRDVNQLRALHGVRDSGVWGFYLPYGSGGVIITPRIGPRSTRRDSVHRVPSEIEDSFSATHVMLHEYTHHFMFNNFNFGAPLWLSEGYPEFFASAQFEDDGSVTIGTPPWYRNYEIANAAEINAEQILLRPSENHRVAGIYGIGWLMSHYLTLHPDRQGQLRAYMQALSQGQEPEVAAAVFGDLGRLTSALRDYRRASQFGVSRIPAARLATGPIAIRELSAGEDAIMDVRIRSKRGVDRERAQSVVRDARQAAAPYPNDPFVQVTLAEAEFDAGNFAEAEAAADRAIAANPRLIDAHLYKARAIWGRAEKAEDKSPAIWAEVRRIIAGANRIDPDDPEPLMLFYQSYEPSGVEPSDNAIEALLQAHALAPQDTNLRMLAARELLRRNRSQEAGRAWAPIVNGAHGRENREKVAEVMTLIRAGNAPAALAKLDEIRAEAERENEGS